MIGTTAPPQFQRLSNQIKAFEDLKRGGIVRCVFTTTFNFPSAPPMHQEFMPGVGSLAAGIEPLRKPIEVPRIFQRGQYVLFFDDGTDYPMRPGTSASYS